MVGITLPSFSPNAAPAIALAARSGGERASTVSSPSTTFGRARTSHGRRCRSIPSSGRWRLRRRTHPGGSLVARFGLVPDRVRDRARFSPCSEMSGGRLVAAARRRRREEPRRRTRPTGSNGPRSRTVGRRWRSLLGELAAAGIETLGGASSAGDARRSPASAGVTVNLWDVGP